MHKFNVSHHMHGDFSALAMLRGSYHFIAVQKWKPGKKIECSALLYEIDALGAFAQNKKP